MRRVSGEWVAKVEQWRVAIRSDVISRRISVTSPSVAGHRKWMVGLDFGCPLGDADEAI